MTGLSSRLHFPTHSRRRTDTPGKTPAPGHAADSAFPTEWKSTCLAGHQRRSSRRISIGPSHHSAAASAPVLHRSLVPRRSRPTRWTARQPQVPAPVSPGQQSPVIIVNFRQAPLGSLSPALEPGPGSSRLVCFLEEVPCSTSVFPSPSFATPPMKRIFACAPPRQILPSILLARNPC